MTKIANDSEIKPNHSSEAVEVYDEINLRITWCTQMPDRFCNSYNCCLNKQEVKPPKARETEFTNEVMKV